MPLTDISESFVDYKDILKNISERNILIPDRFINPSDLDFLIVLFHLVTEEQQKCMYKRIRSEIIIENQIISNVSVYCP